MKVPGPRDPALFLRGVLWPYYPLVWPYYPVVWDSHLRRRGFTSYTPDQTRQANQEVLQFKIFDQFRR